MITGSALNEPAVRLRRRSWLLLLMDVAERTGLTPLPSDLVHQLAFLANVLTPIYALDPQEAEILKHPRGPYYHEMQWDLDRLAAQGLLHISRIRYEHSEEGGWFYADYALSWDGVTAVRHLVGSPRAARTHAYLHEVASAYAAIHKEVREEAGAADATYSDPRLDDRTIVTLTNRAKNLSVQTADGFQAYAPEGVRLRAQDKLHLYFRYLNRMVEKPAG